MLGKRWDRNDDSRRLNCGALRHASKGIQGGSVMTRGGPTLCLYRSRETWHGLNHPGRNDGLGRFRRLWLVAGHIDLGWHSLNEVNGGSDLPGESRLLRLLPVRGVARHRTLGGLMRGAGLPGRKGHGVRMLLTPLDVGRSQSYDCARNPHSSWRIISQNLFDLIRADDNSVVGVDVPLDEIPVSPLGAQFSNNGLSNKGTLPLVQFLAFPVAPLR